MTKRCFLSLEDPLN